MKHFSLSNNLFILTPENHVKTDSRYAERTSVAATLYQFIYQLVECCYETTKVDGLKSITKIISLFFGIMFLLLIMTMILVFFIFGITNLGDMFDKLVETSYPFLFYCWDFCLTAPKFFGKT